MIIIEENDSRFYTAESTILNAGLGLFAKEKIKKDDWVEVIGVMVKKGDVSDRCTNYAKKYKFAGVKEDYKIIPMGYAGMINHTDDSLKLNMKLTCIKGLKKRSQHASEIVYVALRDIEPGEELLGNYGEQIGRDIEGLVKNDYKNDWDAFLDHDLYDLKRLINLI